MKKMQWILIGLLFCFVFVRLPGLSLPYHQDEWKTAWAIENGDGLSGLHHPPLTQIFFNLDGAVFSADNLRVMPFLFSITAFILLFLVVKNRAGSRNAIAGLGLVAICFYSVFASVMVDTDGVILPTFFLLAVYFYDKWRNALGITKYKWLAWLIIALIAGFMTKLSFVIAVGAVLLDFIFDNYKNITSKQITKGLLALAGFFGLAAVLTIIIYYVYPSFDIGSMISHAASYAHFEGRNYFQSMIQGVKSLYYLSPLLLAPLLFTDKEIFRKMRVFYLYLILGFIFYFVLFDFSSGALDKYLMFAIVPLSAISGMIIAQNLKKESFTLSSIFLGIIISLLLLLLNFLPHSIIGLYPKAEWFSRVFHFKWDMLNPFTGGNGPVGFYISFLFIAASFITSFLFGIAALFKKGCRNKALIVIMFIGLSYNVIFIEELYFGKINGDSSAVLASTLNFVKSSPQISEVITYNDIGAYELHKMGVYEGRFYAAPQYEAGHQMLFSQFDGNYLIVDIPHLYQSGFYGEFFAKCHPIYTTSSGRIFGYVVSCPKPSN